MPNSEEASIVIVGAGAAGTSAAVSARDAGWQGRITLFGSEPHLPYERPPLSKSNLIDDPDPGLKHLLTQERFSELRISYVPDRKVSSIDRQDKRLRVSDGSTVRYHRLLLATGASPRLLDVPIADASSVMTLRTYADAVKIRAALTPGCRFVIVGGGFIGLEVAASAVQRGADVIVIEAGQRILARGVPEAISRLIMLEHERHGVTFKTAISLKRIDSVDGKAAVVLSDGTVIAADLVVVGVGASPNTALAQEAGLQLDNGIRVDETLCTSDPDIFAAGDCCSFPHRLYGKQIRLEAWRNAERQGALAGQNMVEKRTSYAEVPWFWSDQYDRTLQVAGLVHEGDIPIQRDFGDKGSVMFHLSPGGTLVAACAFGSLGTIAKEIRFAEMLIAARSTPSAKDLADPTVSIKSLR